MKHTPYDLTEDDLYWYSKGVEQESGPDFLPCPRCPSTELP